MYPQCLPALLLFALISIPGTLAVDFSMMSVSGTRAGTGNPVYTRCTNVASDTCCYSLTPYDMAAFDDLPENAASTYWSWNGSPNLPANVHAKCDQKMLKCDAMFPMSWYAAPAPRSNTATRSIITGGKWLAYSKAGNKVVTTGLEASVMNAMTDITSMCKNLFTRGNSMVSRRDRRAPNVAKKGFSRWVYPDIIMYNGTKFSDDHRNDKIYRDWKGNVFDLKLLDAWIGEEKSALGWWR